MRVRPALALALFALISAVCVACSARTGKVDPTDWNLGKSYGQMKDEFYERSTSADAKKGAQGADAKGTEPPIPEVSPILAAPRAPDVGMEKLVSLSLTEEVPLKDVLVELGRLSDIDMEIDPGIKGGVILRVKDKPLSEVMRRIADLSGLRITQEKGVVRIERDLPYLVNYRLDFLNMTRTGSGSVSMSTQVLSSGGAASGGSGGGGLTTGSSSSLSSSTDGDLWKAVEGGIKDVLSFDPLSQISNGESDVDVKVAANADSGKSKTQTLSINKQTGVVSVLANDRQHKNVKAFIDRIRTSASAQVLIEAKVVEVELSEDYRTGIDWGGAVFDNHNWGLKLGNVKYSGIASGTTGTIIGVLNGANSLKASVSLLESFGSTHTLSSPRINAMNNQQAVLTFAENKVYFKLKLQEQQTQGSGASPNTNLTIDSTVSTVPVGVMLNLQPVIDLESSEITMNIRPTLSRVTTSVEDPGVAIIAARSAAAATGSAATALANIKSEVPVIKVREMDSVLKIKSGQIMVIGGLMEDTTTSTDQGVPFLGRVPLIGNAFKGTVRTGAITETVIFIKATIVPPEGVSPADKSLYKNFTRDPRPVAF